MGSPVNPDGEVVRKKAESGILELSQMRAALCDLDGDTTREECLIKILNAMPSINLTLDYLREIEGICEKAAKREPYKKHSKAKA